MRTVLTVAGALALAACTGAPPAPVPTASPTFDPRTPAQPAYDAASSMMHAGMGAADRDADVAFARGMIPHHRGAVEMAKIELTHGRDPELRRLAQAVIRTQEAEIAMLERWLAWRGETRHDNSQSQHGH